MLVSCSHRVTENKKNSRLSIEFLKEEVLKQLGLDVTKTHLVDSKIQPNNSNEAIMVFSEEEPCEENRECFSSHIVIINSITGKIKNYFSESSALNGWISDAIFLEGISIDGMSYELNTSQNTIGIRTRFRSMSQPNPYREEAMSLFIKEKNSLKKVLDNYTIYESFGEVNVGGDSCDAEFRITENSFAMSSLKTNGYYDLLVNKVVKHRTYKENEDGECNPIDEIIASETLILKFNGIEYK